MYPLGGGLVQLDLARCRDVLLAESLLAPKDGWPAGAPARDYQRSPAAARVGRFASESGLRLFHYEYREQFDLLPTWLPEGVSDDFALSPEWERGVLAERKYQSFRHDQMLGGFNPGHRGKWTSHELCHGLVGFGYRADPPPMFLATAGRLAELVPVVLWYFLDEIGLQRCAVHQGSGALFREYCPACEQLAAGTRDDHEAERHLAGAARFMDNELAAVARSRRLGRPVPHQWATINLCSDGLAYAHSHGERLRSNTFATYAERFLKPGTGHSETLDALEARALEVFFALCGQQETLAGWASAPWLGGLRWKIQDLGWRLTVAVEGMDGEPRHAVNALLDSLARLCEQTVTDGLPDSEISTAWSTAVERLRGLDAVLGEGSAASIGAVGYPIGDLGYSVPLIEEGLGTVTPLTMQLLEDAQEGLVVSRFIAADEDQRVPLVERWTAYLRENSDSLLAGLATFEAALIQAKLAPNSMMLGRWAGGPARLGDGYRIHRFNWNVVDVAARVETGELFGVQEEGGFRIADEGGRSPRAAKQVLLVGYEPGGELVLADIDEQLAVALEQGATSLLPESTLAWLAEIGAIEPEAWPL